MPVEGGAVSNPTENPAAQTPVGKTPSAAPRSIASFFHPVPGERGAAGTTPSAAAHDTARTAEARPTVSTAAENSTAPAAPATAGAAETCEADPTAETPAALTPAPAPEKAALPPTTNTLSASTAEKPAAAPLCGEPSCTNKPLIFHPLLSHTL